jgi:hypothetical protein
MSPLTALWIATGLGAVLFFACGFLTARASRWFSQVIPDLRQASLQATLDRTQLFHADAQKEQAARAEQLASSLRSALRGSQVRLDELEQALQSHAPALARLAALEKEHARLLAQARSAAVQGSAPAAAEQREKLVQLHAQCDKLSLALERSRKLAGSVPELHRQIEELGRNLGETTQAQWQWQERARALEQELAQLKISREASVRHPTAHQQTDAGELLASGAERSSGLWSSQSGTRRRITYGAHTLEAALERHLSALSAGELDVSAVLADDDGFALVGIGSQETQEGLAVLTSLAHTLAARAEEFAGLGDVELMELADSSGRAIRVRFFEWEGQSLALGHIGNRQLSVREDEERMVSSFPQLLLVGKSA